MSENFNTNYIHENWNFCEKKFYVGVASFAGLPIFQYCQVIFQSHRSQPFFMVEVWNFPIIFSEVLSTKVIDYIFDFWPGTIFIPILKYIYSKCQIFVIFWHILGQKNFLGQKIKNVINNYCGQDLWEDNRKVSDLYHKNWLRPVALKVRKHGSEKTASEVNALTPGAQRLKCIYLLQFLSYKVQTSQLSSQTYCPQ